MTIGARNRYTCEKCRQHIVTEDRDVGVTPFTVPCLATPNCTGTMFSSFYRAGDGDATFIWRKLTADEIIKASPAAREHFKHGGLEIYPIATAKPTMNSDVPQFYRVVAEPGGCTHCGHEKFWTIVHIENGEPTGEGTSWGDQEQAQDICDLMNNARDLALEKTDRLHGLILRVLEWEPAFPVESGLLDELAAAVNVTS